MDRGYECNQMCKVQMIITLRCVVRTMVKHSEYMEAFFGVELNQKFEDMINELKDAEENLKELSLEIGKLGEIKDADNLNESIKE